MSLLRLLFVASVAIASGSWSSSFSGSQLAGASQLLSDAMPFDVSRMLSECECPSCPPAAPPFPPALPVIEEGEEPPAYRPDGKLMLAFSGVLIAIILALTAILSYLTNIIEA